MLALQNESPNLFWLSLKIVELIRYVSFFYKHVLVDYITTSLLLKLHNVSGGLELFRYQVYQPIYLQFNPIIISSESVDTQL